MKVTMRKRVTAKEFIKKAISIHGDLYDYSKINFIDYQTSVEIICKKENHGSFRLKPKSHIYDKTRCPKCTKPGRGNLNWFLEKAKLVHGDLYDYSAANYVNTNTKIDIICKKDNHGIFKQTPNMHLNNKNGCPKCFGCIKYTLEEFIKKSNEIHNYRYDYSKVIYTGYKTKIEIICKIDDHGSFWQLAGNHLKGINCSKCSEKYSGDSKYFIKRANVIHNNLYDYSKIHYTDNRTKVEIICKAHGIFYQTPHDHLDDHGCPKCVHTVSKGEIAWLDSLNIPSEFRNKTIKLNGKLLRPDAIDKQNKIVWEFYGDFWHGNPDIFNQEKINPRSKSTFGELYAKTLEKENILKTNGYQIISIWENEWNKEMDNHVEW